MAKESSDRPKILVLDKIKADEFMFAPFRSSTVDSSTNLPRDGRRGSNSLSSNGRSRKDRGT
jgi:hypothetical protein